MKKISQIASLMFMIASAIMFFAGIAIFTANSGKNIPFSQDVFDVNTGVVLFIGGLIIFLASLKWRLVSIR